MHARRRTDRARFGFETFFIAAQLLLLIPVLFFLLVSVGGLLLGAFFGCLCVFVLHQQNKCPTVRVSRCAPKKKEKKQEQKRVDPHFSVWGEHMPGSAPTSSTQTNVAQKPFQSIAERKNKTNKKKEGYECLRVLSDVDRKQLMNGLCQFWSR